MVAVLKPQVNIRPMRAEDVADVMAIESAAYAFPWTEGIFLDCLQVGYHCFVLEANGRFAGYAVLSVAVEECHILNICVHGDLRGQGLGRQFMLHLLQYARDSGAAIAYLEVRPSNVIATHLYWSIGFEQIALRKDYYPCVHGREDALVLACILKAPAAF
jgi:ribosomal-protein-alanine N-acetyltransferase